MVLESMSERVEGDGLGVMGGSTVRLRVSRRALAANYRMFVAAGAGEVGAVVKANAYGVGALQASKVFIAAGCRCLFVARAAEGVELRRGLAASAEDGPWPGSRELAIYVLEGALPDTLEMLQAHHLQPVLNSPEQFALWAEESQGPIAVHVDTGMNRLGFPADVAPAAFKGREIGLLCTHLACADEPRHRLNAAQLQRIDDLRARFGGTKLSVGNSAGALNGPPFQGHLIRPGIALYGGNPWVDRPNPMRAAAALEAAVVQVRELRPSASVGYGATYTASARRRVAVLGVGYADGLPRVLSNSGEVFAAGRRRPIIGRVSMDLTTVDATDAALQVGDWVEIFGPNLSVDEVAAKANTIAYEILTGISGRVPRLYD